MALCYVLSGVYGAGAGPGPFRFVDLALGCLALLLGWAGWADPLLAPVPRPRRSSPRMVLLTRKVQIWLVPLCLLMLVGLLTTFATEVLGLPETPLTRGMLGIGVAGAMVVGLLVSKRIAELHEQRYRRGIRERGLCFACGYDLRGRPDGGREGVQNAGRWWPIRRSRGRLFGATCGLLQAVTAVFQPGARGGGGCGKLTGSALGCTL
ncbi:MAG: hypothetical protein ACLFVN_12695 [Phycisphaeraceae bacterium]